MNKDYDPKDAAKVTHQNLPKELQEKFTEDDIYEILEIKYHADRQDIQQTMGMYGKRGIDISEEEMKTIARAEEAYLKKLGA